MADHFVIGFTGAFGSGCTTATKHLRDEREFTAVALSRELRDAFDKANPGVAPKRPDLQNLGDQIRQASGGEVLARTVVEKLGAVPKRLVIDGIRNTKEIEYLRDRFGRAFTLIAVLAPVAARWHRLSATYGDELRKEADFAEDDRRDRDEDAPHGQQVDLCVDQSDVFVDNSPPLDQRGFHNKILDTADLILGMKGRHPSEEEIKMHSAFTSAHSSRCLKRGVGAVIADANGQVIALGFNENPRGTHPCVREPKYDYRCFRDIVREEHFLSLLQKGAICPICGNKIPMITEAPWVCPSCLDNGSKTNLENYFFPDRAMSWCTAIHAEAAAILAAGERARGGVLYSTTFPCFQCAEKIVHVGIREVVFTDSYPDKFSQGRLELSGVSLKRFEGVRSSAFERIFKLRK